MCDHVQNRFNSGLRNCLNLIALGCKEPFREPDFIKFLAHSAAMRSLFISSEPRILKLYGTFRRQKINLNSF